MTNINCSENCRHQENGKCRLTHVGDGKRSPTHTGVVSSIGGSKCAYFEQKDPPRLSQPFSSNPKIL